MNFNQIEAMIPDLYPGYQEFLKIAKETTISHVIDKFLTLTAKLCLEGPDGFDVDCPSYILSPNAPKSLVLTIGQLVDYSPETLVDWSFNTFWADSEEFHDLNDRFGDWMDPIREAFYTSEWRRWLDALLCDILSQPSIEQAMAQFHTWKSKMKQSYGEEESDSQPTSLAPDTEEVA